MERPLRDRLDAHEDLARRHAADGERQGDVLARGERVEQVGILEDEAKLLAAKRVSLADFIAVTSAPLTSTFPLVTASMVDTQLSSVDLPEPEAPMMPTNSPRITVNDTSASARVTLLREP